MRKLMSSLIALSFLAAFATSLSAQTKEDEDRFDYWQQQQDNLP